MPDTGIGVVRGVDLGIGRGVAARTGVKVAKKPPPTVGLGSELGGRTIMAASVGEILV